MTPPAALPVMPAAPSARSAPAAAGTPRSDTAPNPFDQHLQAARNTPPAAAAPPTDRPSASTPDAHAPAPGKSSTADAAAKAAAESDMPTPVTTPAASAAAMPSTAAAAPRGQADASPLDAALAAAQAASVATAAGEAATAASSKTAATPKAASPDTEAAATLAGAMLALLGRLTDGTAGAATDADDATVSADGSASGRGGAAVATQGQGLDDKALAAAVAAATPAANPAGMPVGAEQLFAAAGTDTRKDRGLEALALATAPAPMPAPPTPAPLQPQLPLSPGSSGFADELGQQVVWMGQQDIQQAKIRLHPEDLGSLDVHLSVSHDRVDVVFSAQHPAAVTAVQQSLPQLDHMLARHGLSLGHAEVGQQNRGDGGGARGESRGAMAATDEIDAVHASALPVATGRIGLLDAFA
ncbi:flagellar hook-length control protein FliK [Rhodanobacter geophilus]|uniref:Flagellar hook-length control protein FliK n=1 Tax=Rhodanobacter geophilus TaxID=3162488 RepID=A0ABV3QTR7_9GAMM